MSSKPLLQNPIQHIDITSFDARPIIDSMSHMSFASKDLANAAHIYNTMLQDPDCTIFLSLAGSTSAAGCMNIYSELVKHNMVDVIVSTGASIVDMDFHEALGFKHYQGHSLMNDNELGEQMIDRIYSVLIDEEELKLTDQTVYELAKEFSKTRNVASSREFINYMGKWLADGNAKKSNSLVEQAHKNQVPVFCPAFSDCSAGFGLVKLRQEAHDNDDLAVCIDSVADFHELTQIKVKSKKAGIIIIGGGTPCNFTLDTVICAEVLGQDSLPFDYALKISIADSRDGGLSGSELRELNSWRKANLHDSNQATVFSEATTTLPLLASDAYHRGHWKNRQSKNYSSLFKA